MNTEVKKLEKSMVEIKAVFDTEEWATAQEKALNKLAGSVKLDGFRKGHAPKNLIKAKIGAKALREQAVEEILSENYAKIFVDNNVTPVAQPTANIVKSTETELEVTFTCPVKPEFELGEYKGLEVKKAQVRVTKKDVEERLNDYQKQFAELVVKEEGTVEEGDTAVIDYEGFKDGVAFEGGKAENYSLEIGSHSFIPGFEEGLVGMAAGEEKEINLTFPKEYHAADLAGAEVVFKVKVHEIKAKVLPEIDDELAKDVNIEGVETLEQLQEKIKDQIRTMKKAEAENKFNEEVIKAVVANNTIDVPDAMVDSEVMNIINEINQNLSQQGLNIELYTKMTGKTMDDIKADVRDQAEERVKLNLILDEIVKAENIEVTDAEMEDEMKEIATYYNMPLEEVKKVLGGQEYAVKGDLTHRKALQLIKDNVK